MAPSPSLPDTRVDAWELRCRFNRAHYYERLLNGEFTLKERVRPIKPGNRLATKFTHSVEVYYSDGDGDQVARAHYYRRVVGGTTPHDPKELCLDGMRYHLFEGSSFWDRVKREPEAILPSGCAKRAYGKWRKFKCDHWGR